MNPPTFQLIFLVDKILPCLWSLACKKILIGGFYKGKVHICTLNGFKIARPQTLRMLGIEPGPPEDTRFAYESCSFDENFHLHAELFLTANFEH